MVRMWHQLKRAAFPSFSAAFEPIYLGLEEPTRWLQRTQPALTWSAADFKSIALRWAARFVLPTILRPCLSPSIGQANAPILANRLLSAFTLFVQAASGHPDT